MLHTSLILITLYVADATVYQIQQYIRYSIIMYYTILGISGEKIILSIIILKVIATYPLHGRCM